jgi:hypothetical protein
MTTSSQVSIHNLNQLILNAQNPVIDSYDALTRELFGQKLVVVKVFHRLLRWLPCSKRKDGAVYKSARELAKETASSEVSVARSRGLLERIGFDIFVKKANGAPTNHFKLNLPRFLQTLATIFKTTVETICVWLWTEPAFLNASDRQNSFDQDDRIQSNQDDTNVSVRVIESITPEDTTKKTNNKNDKKPSTEPVDSLSSQNLFKNSSKTEKAEDAKFAQMAIIEEIRAKLKTSNSQVQSWIHEHGINRVHEVFETGLELEREGKIYKSLYGWVNYTLKNPQGEKPKSTLTDDREPGTLGGTYSDFIRR